MDACIVLLLRQHYYIQEGYLHMRKHFLKKRLKKQLKKLAAVLSAAAILSGVPVTLSEAAVTSAQAIAKGIDVSKYQGAVDWNSVAAQGYSFAFVKIGSSKSGVDPTFMANMLGASAAGLRTGGYIYSYATTVEAAVAEATLAISALQNMPVSFPVVFDIEDEVHKGLTPGQQQEIVNAFCTVIENEGYYPMVYASKNWFMTRLGPTVYDQWVAQYADACDYPFAFSVWQATSNGAVPGISGRVDINYLYKDYSQLIIPNGWISRKGFNYFYENWHMKRGWINYADAVWYTDAMGRMVTGWQDLEGNGTKRYFAPEGPMAIGITKVGENTYYFAADGVMQTGWQTIGGFRYLLGGDGVMQFGWYRAPEGTYYFGDTGAMATGWLTLADQKTYHFDEQKGLLSVSTFVTTNGLKYYVDTDGSMVRGFKNIGGANYYFAPDGSMQTGLIPVDGKNYYFAADGVMQTGWQTIGGQRFFFDPATGAMQTGFISDGTAQYYLAPNGAAVSGWQDIDGKRYHFDETTNAMSVNTLVVTNGVTFYVGMDGTLQTGWQNIGGVPHYFQADGSMAANIALDIEGVTYQFDANGVGVPVIVPVPELPVTVPAIQ